MTNEYDVSAFTAIGFRTCVGRHDSTASAVFHRLDDVAAVQDRDADRHNRLVRRYAALDGT